MSVLGGEVRLCPIRSPLPRLPSVISESFTLHAATPITLQVSSIGSVVRLGKYVTLFGPSMIRPIVY